MAKVKINSKFEWDTDDLIDYIDENRDDLETRIVEEARSVRLMKTQQGIKGTQQLNDIDTDVTWQSGTACGFNPTGDDVFGSKNITVADIKIEKEYCNSQLIGFWPQTKLKPGAKGELTELPFEQVILNDMLKKNAMIVDNAIWQGDTASLNPNLNKFDGLLKQLEADVNVTDLNPEGVASITNSNAVEVFKDALDVVPAEIASDDRHAFGAGWDVMRKLMRNIGDANLYHYKIEELIEGKKKVIALIIPGTETKVYYMPGLTGTGKFVSGLFGSDGRVIVGTDQESEWTQIQTGYDERLESLWYRIKFRLGTTYRFSEEMGIFVANS